MKKEELKIIGKHIKDPNPPKDLLIDHVFGTDGKARNSRLFAERVYLAATEIVRKCGQRKPTRDQICARLAGSALIGHNLGYFIKEMQIGVHLGEPAGFVDFNSVFDKDNISFMLFREAAGTIAGFSAEQYVGLSHPFSSVQNKMAAAAICRYMSVSAGKEEWHFFNRALDYCQTTLSTNVIQFNKLRGLLAASNYVGREDALNALKTACCIPVDGYLYA